MIIKVIKRDGRTVDFNFSKIEDAIRKAMDASGVGIDAILAATIADNENEINYDLLNNPEGYNDVI